MSVQTKYSNLLEKKKKNINNNKKKKIDEGQHWWSVLPMIKYIYHTFENLLNAKTLHRLKKHLTVPSYHNSREFILCFNDGKSSAMLDDVHLIRR